MEIFVIIYLTKNVIFSCAGRLAADKNIIKAPSGVLLKAGSSGCFRLFFAEQGIDLFGRFSERIIYCPLGWGQTREQRCDAVSSYHTKIQNACLLIRTGCFLVKGETNEK